MDKQLELPGGKELTRTVVPRERKCPSPPSLSSSSPSLILFFVPLQFSPSERKRRSKAQRTQIYEEQKWKNDGRLMMMVKAFVVYRLNEPTPTQTT
jgi:hypothetical protein